MSLILRKIRSLAGLAPKTSEEFEFDINTWTSALSASIPLEGTDNLEACFDLAMKNHRDSFPIAYQELLTAHDQILAAQPRQTVCSFCEAKKKNPALPECSFHRGSPSDKFNGLSRHSGDCEVHCGRECDCSVNNGYADSKLSNSASIVNDVRSK